MRHGGARAEKSRAQVQAEDEVPVLDGHLPDLAVAAAPDVVDEDVEPAESLGRHLDEPGGAAFFREIPRERHGRASGVGDGGRGALELGAVDVAEGHAGTLPRQEERDLPLGEIAQAVQALHQAFELLAFIGLQSPRAFDIHPCDAGLLVGEILKLSRHRVEYRRAFAIVPIDP